MDLALGMIPIRFVFGHIRRKENTLYNAKIAVFIHFYFSQTMHHYFSSELEIKDCIGAGWGCAFHAQSGANTNGVVCTIFKEDDHK